MRVRVKAGRKREGRKEHAHSTLNHPHNIHRLCVTPLPQLEVQELVRLGGGQHGLLFRERQHEEGGAPFVFDFEFSFRGFGKGSCRASLRLDYSSSSTEEATSIPSSPFPHLHNSTSPAIPTPRGPFQLPLHRPIPYLPLPSSITPPRTVPYRCMHTSTPPRTPTTALRTDAALSVGVRSWGAVQGRGRVGGGGRQGCWFEVK